MQWVWLGGHDDGPVEEMRCSKWLWAELGRLGACLDLLGLGWEAATLRKGLASSRIEKRQEQNGTIMKTP